MPLYFAVQSFHIFTSHYSYYVFHRQLGDVDAFPDELKVLLNKIFLFRIEVSAFYVSKGKPHTIRNITGDQSLIDQFKSASLSIQVLIMPYQFLYVIMLFYLSLHGQIWSKHFYIF